MADSNATYVPDWDVLGFNTPNSNAPNLNAPNLNAPGFNAPNSNAPNSNAPNSNAPNSNAPNSNAPDHDIDMDQERSLTPRPATPTFVNTGSKRPRSPSLGPGLSSHVTKKARQINQRTKHKAKAPSDWHLKKGEVPADSAKTKVCMVLFKILL